MSNMSPGPRMSEGELAHHAAIERRVKGRHVGQASDEEILAGKIEETRESARDLEQEARDMTRTAAKKQLLARALNALADEGVPARAEIDQGIRAVFTIDGEKISCPITAGRDELTLLPQGPIPQIKERV